MPVGGAEGTSLRIVGRRALVSAAVWARVVLYFLEGEEVRVWSVLNFVRRVVWSVDDGEG